MCWLMLKWFHAPDESSGLMTLDIPFTRSHIEIWLDCINSVDDTNQAFLHRF